MGDMKQGDAKLYELFGKNAFRVKRAIRHNYRSGYGVDHLVAIYDHKLTRQQVIDVIGLEYNTGRNTDHD